MRHIHIISYYTMRYTKGGKMEVAKRNKNFVQVKRDGMPELRWLMLKSATASAILNFITEHMDYNNSLCCSQEVFMDYFSISRATVARAIKLLRETGFIYVYKIGTSNVYVVNPEIYWSSYGDREQFCKFEGVMLANKKTTKDYIYKNQFNKVKKLDLKEKK